MAETYTIEKLSGSTDGKGIKVTGTSSAADVTVHTATANANDIDLVTIYAVNQDSVDRTVTLAWGAETSPDNLMTATIPPVVGPVLVVDRLPLMNALVLGAWASAADVVMVYGHVQRVDKS